MRQGTDGSGGRSGNNLRQTGQTVLAIDVHGARTADTLTARSSESKRGVLLVLDLEQSVEDHRAATTEFRNRSGKILIEVDHVLLVVRLDILGRVVAEKAEELEAQEARAELKDLKQRYREHLWGEEESEGK